MELLSRADSLVTNLRSSGPVHTVYTVTGTSTFGLNSTVQVSMTLDPTGWMGLGLSLVTTTEDGAGTEEENKSWYLQQ